MATTLASVHAGRIAPLGPDGVPSAFVKRALAGAARVVTLGLELDEQADLTVHGGPDKAVYAYAAAHYARWISEWPQLAPRLVPGGFGENLTITGMEEADLCVGDVHGIGSTRLQVCQPRQPCFKLALHFANKRMPRALVRSGRSGWYYRVLSPGTLRAGDAVELLDRPLPDFPFNTLLEYLYGGELDDAALARIAGTEALPHAMRSEAAEALDARRSRP